MTEKDPITKKPKQNMHLHFDQRVFLRSIMRFKSIYGVFPRGWGKCVKGDTYLFTDKGVIPIKKLFECEENGIEDYTKKIDLTIINKNNEKEKIDRGVYNGYKKTKKITTSKGYSIECSENHPLIIKKKDGDDFVLASDIKVGDKALISYKNDIWGSNTKLDLDKTVLESRRDYPEKLTIPFATIIGYLIAEGDLNKKNKLVFSSDCEKAIVEYMNYFKNLGFDVWLEDNCNYSICNTQIRKYFEQIGLGYVKDNEKEIPECIMTAPKHIVAATLRGIFDDLSVIRRSAEISINVSSEKLSNQIQLLLLNFGIISCRRQIEKNDMYEIRIYGRNTLIFIKEIGTDIAKNKNIFDFFLNTINSEIREGFCTDKYIYDKIVSIEDSEAHVYDISVPDTHSFVSNGFYSHNTWGEVICMFIAAILYPGIQLSMTAQTKGNAAELLSDKYNDITSKYPLLKNEAYKPRKSKDDFELIFMNGSRIDVLANSQTSKGQRRHRIMIEESALLDNQVYEDALKPIVEVGRYTVGSLGIKDPMELNQKNDFFTTSGFRGSSEWRRNVQMYRNMVDLKGEIILGSGWFLGSWMGRGSNKSQILDLKAKTGAMSFARNYEEKWVGATENQLVDINKLLKTRNLTNYLKDDLNNEREIVLGVDVARSAKTSNNKTVVSVIEIVRHDNGLVKELRLVNMFLVSNQLNFTVQACLVKKIQKQYMAKIVIIDANGLGAGLRDELLKPNMDMYSGEEYEAWDSVSGDVKSDYRNAKPLLFCLLSQSRDETKKDGRINSYAIINFIDCVESGKLRVLEERKDNTINLADMEAVEDFVPFEQTNALISEIANLKLVHLSNGEVNVERVMNKIDKDRFSSLIYALWWIMSYDNNIEDDDMDLMLNIAKMNSMTSTRNSDINNLFR